MRLLIKGQEKENLILSKLLHVSFLCYDSCQMHAVMLVIM